MMKKIILLSVIGFCFSFSSKKNKTFIPPGTKQITETLFADETEISNFAWREYESWTKTRYGVNSKEHLETLPDTLVWRNPKFYNEPYVIHYYRHAAYKDYPVVGVSYEQALAFCKWRTDRVKEYYYLKNKKDIAIEYQLPTKEQWELLCSDQAGLFTRQGRNEKGEHLINCYREEDTLSVSVKNEPDVAAPVYSYYKNQFGLYNMIGNVSEMIFDKGISKGGSWSHKLEECFVDKDLTYNKPESWLGFRCVCVVNTTS